MKAKLLEYREIALQVFILLLVAYIFILVYKHNNPYFLFGIEERFTHTLIIIGIITVILYLPYEKISKVLKKITGISFTINVEKVFKPVISLSVGQKFVLVAIILLVSAAIVLAVGNENDANRIAILAYYSLVLGVLNLLVEYVMNPEENRSDPYPDLRAIVSLAVLGILMYSTPEITRKFPHAYLIPFIVSFLVIYPKLMKKIDKMVRR